MFKYIRIVFVSLAVFALTVPQFADARAGGGRSSMGSRGARTYSTPSNAKPIQRSMTQPTTKNGTQTAQPGFTPQPAGAFANNGGSSFWRGVAGGFLGAGIGSMLFGHSASASGVNGSGSGSGNAFGGLLQILLLGGVGYFIYRMYKNSSQGNPRNYMNNMSPAMNNIIPGNFTSSNNAYAEQYDNTNPINISDNDKTAFEQLLTKIQHSWSEGELNKLRQFVTPEMLQYFSEEMSANASRGLANKVENVKLESADIIEAWNEFDLDYATARLQWSAFDYMVSLDKKEGEPGYVVSGSNTNTEIAEEIWTFARSKGGNWLLSAIQQIN